MKKGFTLTELIAALVVLAAIGLIVLPVVSNTIRSGKDDLYKAQIKEIEEATEKWAYLNLDLLPNEGDSVTITILELKKAGLLPLNVKDPRTGELLPNDMEVVINCNNNIYSFVVNEESGSIIESEINENSPVLILNGNPIEYVEIGNNYIDKGAKAKNKFGDNINDINITYQYNGIEIGILDTSLLRTYTVIYSVSSEINEVVYTSKITRTVVVRDTTNPELTIPGKVEITLAEASGYNLLDGVVVTDNSGEKINVTTTGFDVSIGEKIVSYTACDSNQNCITKKRIINITE